ncbi:hypothetical protein GYH30_053752 [Glycine max]|nr:hypothetical protein GYH30_053752 [Glycine max]
METETADPLFSVQTMKGRKAPPSQYTFKIKSFSWLSKASVQKCTSEEFEAGGVGEGHVSIYLVLMDSSSLPADWEVNAIANFSAYNFIDDEYKCKRFHVLRTEWGVTKFIDIDTNPSNGLSDGRYLWKFNSFSLAKSDKYESESFVGGNYKWYIYKCF